MSSAYTLDVHDIVAHERTWCAAVVDAHGAAGVVLSESTLDLRALPALHVNAARSLGVLPLAIVEGALWVASAAPLPPATVAALATAAQRAVVVLLAAGPLVAGAIEAAYAAGAGGALVLAGLCARHPAPYIEVVRPDIRAFLEPLALTCARS